MKNILVLYYSKTGHTADLARHVARGIEKHPECSAHLHTIAPIDGTTPTDQEPALSPEALADFDGLVLGSPTYFGTIAAPVKHFLEQTSGLWLKGSLVNKPAGVFTSTGSLHGGQEATLWSMIIPLMHQGMLITGIPYQERGLSHTRSGGTPYGASHTAFSPDTPISDDERALARALGLRVATLAATLEVDDDA